MTYTQALLLGLLADAKRPGADAGDGILVGAKVALIKNNVAESVNLTWDDLVEADFTGYARSAAVTWGTPAKSSDTGVPVMGGDVKHFACSGGAEQTVYSYAIVSGATPPVLLALKTLPTPEIMASGGFIDIVPRVGYRQEAIIPPGDVTLT